MSSFSSKFILTKTLICFLLVSSSLAQRLDKFASITNQINGHKIPYDKTVTYFGYIKPDSVTSETQNEKSLYYLYFSITDTAKEIGIRLISPVPDVVMPDKGDLVAENYFENEKDKKKYFDPWIKVERAIDFTNEAYSKNDTSFKWILLGVNDDSSELFAQPDGKSNNALLRILSKSDSTEKMLLPGLYRIGFTNSKKPDVKGSFVIQLGVTDNIFRGKLVTSKEELFR